MSARHPQHDSFKDAVMREFDFQGRIAFCSRWALWEVARDCPMVCNVIEAWRTGRISWEEAMIQAVVHLSHENTQLRQQITKMDLLRPVTIELKTPGASNVP